MLGIQVKPSEVRLRPNEDDLKYAWKVDDPSLEPLFEKHLSKHSVGAYMQLYREVGQSFHAVHLDSFQQVLVYYTIFSIWTTDQIWISKPPKPLSLSRSTNSRMKMPTCLNSWRIFKKTKQGLNWRIQRLKTKCKFKSPSLERLKWLSIYINKTFNTGWDWQTTIKWAAYGVQTHWEKWLPSRNMWSQKCQLKQRIDKMDYRKQNACGPVSKWIVVLKFYLPL